MQVINSITGRIATQLKDGFETYVDGERFIVLGNSIIDDPAWKFIYHSYAGLCWETGEKTNINGINVECYKDGGVFKIIKLPQ